MATREQVLAAYAANPGAELNPSEEAIKYWQGAGLGSFNATVDAVRAENPALAAQIDAQRVIADAYQDIGRTGVGTAPTQIDQPGLDYWTNELLSGRVAPNDFDRVFGSAVSEYVQGNPTAPVTQTVAQYRPFSQPLPPTPAAPRIPATSVAPVAPVAPQQPYTGAFPTPGLANSFANYTSIPIGAQYNPGVTAGGASPYSQIMAQTPGFVNPYANVVSGLPMGGYNPNIYDPNLLSNFVRQRAAELRAAGLPVPLGSDGGDGAGDGAGSAAGDGGSGVGGAADGGSGPGDGPGTGAGWYMGGLIDRVSGKNPAGPDDGQINVQVGEYVVKKSSVNKYGKGLLDMINEGKIPAKKIKSLLD